MSRDCGSTKRKTRVEVFESPRQKTRRTPNSIIIVAKESCRKSVEENDENGSNRQIYEELRNSSSLNDQKVPIIGIGERV
jgi:hypothetical protein